MKQPNNALRGLPGAISQVRVLWLLVFLAGVCTSFFLDRPRHVSRREISKTLRPVKIKNSRPGFPQRLCPSATKTARTE
jgi:hypothetical protein